MLAFVSFAPTLELFGEGNVFRCVLHACISYVFIGTLARRKKTILSQLAIIIRVRHDTPHSLNRTKRSRHAYKAGGIGPANEAVRALSEAAVALAVLGVFLSPVACCFSFY